MGWYQCSCGLLTEKTAQLGEAVTSVYHLHRARRLDGSAALTRMEEIPAIACASAFVSTDDASGGHRIPVAVCAPAGPPGHTVS